METTGGVRPGRLSARSWDLIKTGLFLFPSPTLHLFLISKKIRFLWSKVPHRTFGLRRRKITSAWVPPLDIWHPFQATHPTVHWVPAKEGDCGDPGRVKQRFFKSRDISWTQRGSAEREEILLGHQCGVLLTTGISLLSGWYIWISSRASFAKKGMKPTVAEGRRNPVAAVRAAVAREPHPLSHPTYARGHLVLLTFVLLHHDWPSPLSPWRFILCDPGFWDW